MLKGYIDRGARQSGLMCVSAVLFKPTPYKQFCRTWRPFLKRWGADAFHATDFYNGAGDFRRENASGGKEVGLDAQFHADCRLIPRVVSSNMTLACVVSFDEAEFKRVAPQQWQ